MAKFGSTSKSRLRTCHPNIQKIMNKVIEHYDCSILEGARSIERQRELFDSHRSKTMNSKHIPVDGFSHAIDVVPYPIAWGEKERKRIFDAFKRRDTEVLNAALNEYRYVLTRFYHFAGYVQGVADEMDIPIRWGGDWDSDRVFSDQTFNDLPHFELK